MSSYSGGGGGGYQGGGGGGYSGGGGYQGGGGGYGGGEDSNTPLPLGLFFADQQINQAVMVVASSNR